MLWLTHLTAVSSSGLGSLPFTEKTWVRFPVRLPFTMTRSEGKYMRRWSRHRVLITQPVASSFASLVLLSRHYVALDHSIYTDTRMYRISRRWLKKVHTETGKLTCWRCSRTLLLHGPLKQKATVDHQPPIRDGGDWRDERIFRVACTSCNHRF